jgi:hypothetical protein
MSSWPTRCASVIRAKSCCAGDAADDELCAVDRAGGAAVLDGGVDDPVVEGDDAADVAGSAGEVVIVALG